MTRARWLVALGAGIAAAAVAADLDTRGWTSGTPAARGPQILAGVADPPSIVFPESVARRVAAGPVVLFYFSPTCSHCRHVAAEVQALSERLAPLGATLVGVVSANADPAALAEFRQTYRVRFDVLTDAGGEIVTAMAARSTPSMMLVESPPAGKKGVRPGELVVRDLWYPYLPGWDALVEGRVRRDVFAAFKAGEYQGEQLCAACHVQEHESWKLTHHSIAWRTLERSGKTDDGACVGCHVTGKGQETGWGSSAPTELTDVGCEACHGPGGPHDGARTEAREACAQCHDAEHSIAFSLEKGLPPIDHYRAEHLSQGERDARIDALWGGEAPRTLLAFPDGRNVGSARCRECHAQAYDTWADSRHAAGMASLQSDGRDRAECVRCHATAKETRATPPDTVAGYDTFGGVGCESCHGPGEAHVAAGGGTGNIQGLGESCPVCVIEAICTSCHTPKWSPEWALEPFLEKIRH